MYICVFVNISRRFLEASVRQVVEKQQSLNPPHPPPLPHPTLLLYLEMQYFFLLVLLCPKHTELILDKIVETYVRITATQLSGVQTERMQNTL